MLEKSFIILASHASGEARLSRLAVLPAHKIGLLPSLRTSVKARSSCRLGIQHPVLRAWRKHLHLFHGRWRTNSRTRQGFA